ncbi:MAG: signal recognition particle-docking protein FtsY [Candidatus Bilamarchaeaceae archaeon]
MFDFLKKKISNFVNKITGKEDDVESAPPSQPSTSHPTEKPAPDLVKEKPQEEKKSVEHFQEFLEEKKVPKEEVTKPQEKKEVKKTEQKKDKIAPSLSMGTVIKSIISKDIEIKKEDIKTMLDSLELDLIEADVDIETSSRIIADIEKRLVGKKVEKSVLNDFIKKEIKDALADAMITGKEFSILDEVRKGPRPFVIIFLGTNGSGKTTTIAKIANLFLSNKISVVLAAADTFRAAAIEQLKFHAEKLNVKLISKDYGSDPASVAFDAINYAKAHNIDVVLVDTAGRQETNTNLMNELKKVNRVIKPNLKIYIAESIGGSAILEQIKSFNSEVGIDGIILTKLDCDAKGGTILSAANVTGVPVIMIGDGQKYENIKSFNACEIASRIME